MLRKYQNGCVMIAIRNINNLECEFKLFSSFNQAAKYLGISYQTLIKDVENDKPRIWNNTYIKVDFIEYDKIDDCQKSALIELIKINKN